MVSNLLEGLSVARYARGLQGRYIRKRTLAAVHCTIAGFSAVAQYVPCTSVLRKITAFTALYCSGSKHAGGVIDSVNQRLRKHSDGQVTVTTGCSTKNFKLGN